MKKMVIVNKYDEVICELEHDTTTGFYKVSPQDTYQWQWGEMFTYLDEGDTFTVKSIWTEE